MIIPAINCQEFDQVKQRLHIAQELLFSAGGETDGWVHIDIADGSFTNGYSTWRDAQEFARLKRHPRLKVEAHIMMTEPEPVAAEWLAAGAHRIIFHLETTANVEHFAAMCTESGARPMLALRPETPISHAAPYLGLVSECQLLGVEPGLSGQLMQPAIIDKIAALRAGYPDMLIEVDGGITPESARRCFAAGANQLVSASALFSDENPAAAYQRLAG